MILKEAIPKFYAERNFVELSKCVNTCRFKLNMTYNSIYKLFNKFTGLSLVSFDEMMEEIDNLENQS